MKASILMPVHDGMSQTMLWLHALAETVDDSVPFEVIVVDCATTDGTVDALATVEGDFLVLRNEDDHGFEAACVQAAGVARGEYLVLLRSDATPDTGWLRPLIAALDADPELAAVRPRVITSTDNLAAGGCLAVRRSSLYGRCSPDGAEGPPEQRARKLASALRELEEHALEEPAAVLTRDAPGKARLRSHPRSIEPTDLCRIAAMHDTDKKVTGYTRFYDELLAPRRHELLRMLEIGLFNGGSFRMWRQYLPNATLIGVDVDPRCLGFEHEIPNSHVRLLDQANRKQLEGLVAELGGEFDFVVDDGGHMMVQQIVSFETIFPHVTSGGIYAIEDLGTSYWGDFGGRAIGEDGTTVAHMKSLVDSVNETSLLPPPPYRSAALATDLAHVRHDVASVHFYPSLAIVIKA